MKISLVTAYHNRKELFYNTLKSIQYYGHDDIEIIVVDDGSDENHILTTINDDFDLNINIIRIEPENKWWKNPCIPFNLGFEKATGDVIILQNPECLHYGDIISYVKDNIEENKYLNFGCYSINELLLKKINKIDFTTNLTGQISDILFPMNFKAATFDGETGWYNHSIYRPRKLHFCSAITKKDLNKIGGFSEEYANGIGYDDDDFIYKIMKNNIN